MTITYRLYTVHATDSDELKSWKQVANREASALASLGRSLSRLKPTDREYQRIANQRVECIARFRVACATVARRRIREARSEVTA